jgi:hypothetical protein
MFFNSVRDSRYMAKIPEPQTSALKALELSGEQSDCVLEYYQLTSQSALSSQEVHRLADLWEQAETDKILTQAFICLDSFRPNLLKDDNLLSKNTSLRAYLSEYIAVLAEARLMKNSGGNQKEIDLNIPYVAMLCLDGSGIVYRNIKDDGFVRLDNVSQTFGEEVCDRCGTKFAGHEHLIFFPKTAFSPTSS